MWEMMRIGIEMQQRMIEAHGKGLKLTRQMLDASEKQHGVANAVAEANRAQVKLIDNWFDLWSWRL